MRDDPRGSENSSESTTGRQQGTDGHNGVRPEGMRTHPMPIDDIIESPIDFVAVQADDELISALGAGMAGSAPGIGGCDADDRIALMLATWKAEVDAEPIPELIDIATATAAVVSGRAPRRRARYLMPLAGAAGLLVFAFGGMSIGAQDARPGDPLWAVSKVLYQEHAESVEALAVVEESRQKAKEALAVGDKTAAAAALEQGMAAATGVLAEDGKGQVVQELQRLEIVVEETIAGVPTKVMDELPVASQPAGTRSESGSGAGEPAEEPSGDPAAADPGADARSLNVPAEGSTGAVEPTTEPTSPTTEGPSTTTEGRPDPTTAPPAQSATEPSEAEGSGSISGASTTASGTATSADEPAPPSTTTPS